MAVGTANVLARLLEAGYANQFSFTAKRYRFLQIFSALQFEFHFVQNQRHLEFAVKTISRR